MRQFSYDSALRRNINRKSSLGVLGYIRNKIGLSKYTPRLGLLQKHIFREVKWVSTAQFTRFSVEDGAQHIWKCLLRRSSIKAIFFDQIVASTKKWNIALLT